MSKHARDSQVKVLIYTHVYSAASFGLKFVFASPLEDLDVTRMVVHIMSLLSFSLSLISLCSLFSLQMLTETHFATGFSFCLFFFLHGLSIVNSGYDQH